MKMVSLKCPDCNAKLNIEITKNRKHFFCEYCGSKIYVDDESTSHTYRKIDVARIKEAETQQTIRLKELQLQEKRLKMEERKLRSEHRLKRFKLFLFMIFAISGVISLIIGYTISNPGFLLYGLLGVITTIERIVNRGK